MLESLSPSEHGRAESQRRLRGLLNQIVQFDSAALPEALRVQIRSSAFMARAQLRILDNNLDEALYILRHDLPQSPEVTNMAQNVVNIRGQSRVVHILHVLRAALANYVQIYRDQGHSRNGENVRVALTQELDRIQRDVLSGERPLREALAEARRHNPDLGEMIATMNLEEFLRNATGASVSQAEFAEAALDLARQLEHDNRQQLENAVTQIFSQDYVVGVRMRDLAERIPAAEREIQVQSFLMNLGLVTADSNRSVLRMGGEALAFASGGGLARVAGERVAAWIGAQGASRIVQGFGEYLTQTTVMGATVPLLTPRTEALTWDTYLHEFRNMFGISAVLGARAILMAPVRSGALQYASIIGTLTAYDFFADPINQQIPLGLLTLHSAGQDLLMRGGEMLPVPSRGVRRATQALRSLSQEMNLTENWNHFLDRSAAGLYRYLSSPLWIMMGASGEGPPSISRFSDLTRQLQHQDVSVRLRALSGLLQNFHEMPGEIQTELSTEFSRLISDTDPIVAGLAVEGIAYCTSIQVIPPRQGITRLLSLLQDPRPLVRGAASRGLSNLFPSLEAEERITYLQYRIQTISVNVSRSQALERRNLLLQLNSQERLYLLEGLAARRASASPYIREEIRDMVIFLFGLMTPDELDVLFDALHRFQDAATRAHPFSANLQTQLATRAAQELNHPDAHRRSFNAFLLEDVLVSADPLTVSIALTERSDPAHNDPFVVAEANRLQQIVIDRASRGSSGGNLLAWTLGLSSLGLSSLFYSEPAQAAIARSASGHGFWPTVFELGAGSLALGGVFSRLARYLTEGRITSRSPQEIPAPVEPPTTPQTLLRSQVRMVLDNPSLVYSNRAIEEFGDQTVFGTLRFDENGNLITTHLQRVERLGGDHTFLSRRNRPETPQSLSTGQVPVILDHEGHLLYYGSASLNPAQQTSLDSLFQAPEAISNRQGFIQRNPNFFSFMGRQWIETLRPSLGEACYNVLANTQRLDEIFDSLRWSTTSYGDPMINNQLGHLDLNEEGMITDMLSIRSLLSSPPAVTQGVLAIVNPQDLLLFFRRDGLNSRQVATLEALTRRPEARSVRQSLFANFQSFHARMNASLRDAFRDSFLLESNLDFISELSTNFRRDSEQRLTIFNYDNALSWNPYDRFYFRTGLTLDRHGQIIQGRQPRSSGNLNTPFILFPTRPEDLPLVTHIDPSGAYFQGRLTEERIVHALFDLNGHLLNFQIDSLALNNSQRAALETVLSTPANQRARARALAENPFLIQWDTLGTQSWQVKMIRNLAILFDLDFEIDSSDQITDFELSGTDSIYRGGGHYQLIPLDPSHNSAHSTRPLIRIQAQPNEGGSRLSSIEYQTIHGSLPPEVQEVLDFVVRRTRHG